MTRYMTFAAACLLACIPARAHASDWAVEAARSSIAFDYKQDGSARTGSFEAFIGTGSFDAAAPEKAKLTLRIDTSSIDLDSILLSAAATSAEWFDSKNHRYAVYRLNGLERGVDGQYTAKGSLQIRGETRPIASKIVLEIDAGSAKAMGTLTLKRWDYLLGVGPSSALVDIGPEVSVRFVLHAKQVP